jgi:tetratricopeptide (TPR) repeat protein
LCVEIGALRFDAGEPTRALADYRQAEKVLETLARQNPSVPGYQADLADFYDQLAHVQETMAEPANAEQSYRRSREVWESLVAAHAGNSLYQSHLGATLNDLGHLREVQGRSQEALADYQEAGKHLRLAHARQPEEANIRQWLGTHYFNLARLQRELGRPAEAAAAAVARQKLWPGNGQEFYSLAGELAACAALSIDKPAERQQFSDEAMQALRQAIASGYRDADKLRSDKKLDPLRQRPDFQKLQAELLHPP